jgi:hypothetical protein
VITHIVTVLTENGLDILLVQTTLPAISPSRKQASYKEEFILKQTLFLKSPMKINIQLEERDSSLCEAPNFIVFHKKIALCNKLSPCFF